MAVVPRRPPERPAWLPRVEDLTRSHAGRAEDRRLADAISAACAMVMLALALVTLPGFFAMHGDTSGEAMALAAGAAFGYLSGGAHPMARRARWFLALGLWGAGLAALAVLYWREPVVRSVAATFWSDARFLTEAWSKGSTPPVPNLVGFPLLLGCAWGIGAFIWTFLRTRRPLPAVFGIVALLVFQWEFLYNGAGRAFWPAVAVGLVWIAAGWARALAERSWIVRPPAAGRIVAVAAVAAVMLLGFVQLLPLNRPAVDLGALGRWVDATFPTLAHIEQGTRITPGIGGGGVGRGVGSGPLAPVSPYTMKMVGFATNDGDLGGPLLTSDSPALKLSVVRGTTPPVLYLRGAADDTYTGRGWIESRSALYPAQPPRRPRGIWFGPGSAPAPRDAFTIKVQPDGLVTSTVFTALTPVGVSGVQPVWDRMGNAWLANPLSPRDSYQVSAVAIKTPTYTPTAATRATAGAGAGGTCFGCTASGTALGLNRLPRAAFADDLQLPSTLPAEVRRLARTWTASATTPLGKALAIQNQLLKIPYSLNAPAPPPGTDFVDQFLFHSRTGYCTYYASAMAVMLRTLDIPSRWVTGFRVHTPAPGKPLIVRDSDAHAWVEAFIAPYGWLVFDPTPWGRTLPKPVTGKAAASAGGSPTSAGPVRSGGLFGLRNRFLELEGALINGSGLGNTPLPRSLALIPLAALAALLAAAGWSAYRNRWNPRDPVGSAARLWAVLERVATHNGQPRGSATTPAEFAADLDVRWPDLAGAAGRMAGAYGELRFGRPDRRLAAAEGLHAAWVEVDRVWSRQAPVRHRLRKLL